MKTFYDLKGMREDTASIKQEQRDHKKGYSKNKNKLLDMENEVSRRLRRSIQGTLP